MIRLLALSAAAIALSGCEVAGEQKYWADCVSVKTGERVEVIDNFSNRPRVRDKGGYEFDVRVGAEWRCRPGPAQTSFRP